jgi:hypothetical protein
MIEVFERSCHLLHLTGFLEIEDNKPNYFLFAFQQKNVFAIDFNIWIIQIQMV